MSVRRILILCLAGAVVLAGSVVAIARFGDGNPGSGDEGRRQTPSPPSGQAPPEPPPSEAPSPPEATSPSVSLPPQAPRPPAPAPAPPAAAPDPPGYQPTMVTPKPGMDNVHKIAWRRAEVLNDRTLRVHFESGVAPCSVLDRVEVQYRTSDIAVTLFEGNDPASKGAACIMIALFKAVDVPLDQPVGARAIVDGGV